VNDIYVFTLAALIALIVIGQFISPSKKKNESQSASEREQKDWPIAAALVGVCCIAVMVWIAFHLRIAFL
jgi:hypothetical protein